MGEFGGGDNPFCKAVTPQHSWHKTRRDIIVLARHSPQTLWFNNTSGFGSNFVCRHGAKDPSPFFPCWPIKQQQGTGDLDSLEQETCPFNGDRAGTCICCRVLSMSSRLWKVAHAVPPPQYLLIYEVVGVSSSKVLQTQYIVFLFHPLQL